MTRRYTKAPPVKVIYPPQEEAASELTPPPIEYKEPVEISTTDIDVTYLLGQTLEILRREIKNLMMQSMEGKLPYNSGRDLVNYVKLLSDIQSKEKDLLDGLSEEEMEKLLKDRK